MFSFKSTEAFGFNFSNFWTCESWVKSFYFPNWGIIFSQLGKWFWRLFESQCIVTTSQIGKCAMGDCFSYIRKLPFITADSATRLPIMPHNSFQMRSGYMNLAPITCAPRTGKIIGTIGSCMDFDVCESKNGTIFVHFSQFKHLWSGLFWSIMLHSYLFCFLVNSWLLVF